MTISSFHFTFVLCCVRHASLQTWLLILSGQKSTGDGLTTHGWPPSGSILSHKLQSLSGAPKSPPHNNTAYLLASVLLAYCWQGIFLSDIHHWYTDAGDQYLIIMARLHRLPPSLLPWSEEVIATQYGVVVAEYDKHGCVHLSGRSYV